MMDFGSFQNFDHLFVGPLSFHGDSVVCPVVRLGAEHAHAGLILLAEQLQEPLVLWAHPVRHVCYRLHQLVLGEPGGVRLEVLLAVGRQAHQAGLDCLWPAFPEANVTEDLLPGRR